MRAERGERTGGRRNRSRDGRVTREVEKWLTMGPGIISEGRVTGGGMHKKRINVGECVEWLGERKNSRTSDKIKITKSTLRRLDTTIILYIVNFLDVCYYLAVHS